MTYWRILTEEVAHPQSAFAYLHGASTCLNSHDDGQPPLSWWCGCRRDRSESGHLCWSAVSAECLLSPCVEHLMQTWLVYSDDLSWPPDECCLMETLCGNMNNKISVCKQTCPPAIPVWTLCSQCWESNTNNKWIYLPIKQTQHDALIIYLWSTTFFFFFFFF